MGGLIADRLLGEGFSLSRRIEAVLPMPVWMLDLEIERDRETSAAELAVLRIVESGHGEPAEITRLMGMRADTRLTEQVLVRLLASLAVEPKGDRFVLSAAGRAWLSAGAVRGRERVSFEVRLDPVRGAFEWVDSEPSAYSSDHTWTIDLPAVGDETVVGRRPEISRLVRDHGLPDDLERPPHERRPSAELRSFAVAGRRTHWRAVRLDLWVHRERSVPTIVANIDQAENPALTSVLATYRPQEEGRRIVLAGVGTP